MVKTYISREHDHPEAFLDRFYNALEELNAGPSYNFVQTMHEADEVAAVSRVFSDVAPELQIDFDFATISLMHFCKDAAAQDALEAVVREKIGFETQEGLLAAAEGDLTARNLLRLGQGYERPYDDRVGEVIKKGLTHSSPKIREFAGIALIGRKYAQLRAELESAIAAETNRKALNSLEMARDALS